MTTPCPVCGGILCREMGTFYRCVACRSLLAVTGDYAEVLGTSVQGSEDARAEAALRGRGA